MINLLQLPIPEVHHLYNEGNIPLAAGYLKAYALSRGTVAADEMDILPRGFINLAGDAAILDRLNRRPAAVTGFTTYMWNLDRNLLLAERLKEKQPDTIVVMGGPEITPDHPLTQSEVVDCLVTGEGEAAFVKLLEDVKVGRKLKKVYQSDTPLDLSALANPYLTNVLQPVRGESIFLETMRGCPYPCAYCFYSKSFAGMRYFPQDQLPQLFELARRNEANEIFFMDPSFNVTPGIMEKLERIRRLNTTGIPIHTETRLEGITPPIAALMQEAGFQSVEAGLQSTNEKSLRAIARGWNRGKFIQGAQLLTEAGIEVKIGVILGLPLDGLKQYEETLDFVMKLGLEDSMEIYTLSMIPGTKLRDDAAAFSLSYMAEPPYFVTGTPYMSGTEIKAAVEMTEAKLGLEFFAPIVPRFHNEKPGLVHFLDLRKKAACQTDFLADYPEKIGHSLTVCAGKETPIKTLQTLGRWLRQSNPSTLVQVVLDRNEPPDLEYVMMLREAFFVKDHYFNRIHHYKIDAQETYSLRFFHLTGDLKVAEDYLYQSMPCDLILRYSPALLGQGRELLDAMPILLVDGPIKKGAANELKALYEGFENFLLL